MADDVVALRALGLDASPQETSPAVRPGRRPGEEPLSLWEGSNGTAEAAQVPAKSVSTGADPRRRPHRAWQLLQPPSSALGRLALDYAVVTLATVIAAVWFVEQRVTSLDAFLIAFFPPSVIFALALKGSYKNTFRAVALDKIGHALTGGSVSAVAVLGLHQVFMDGASAGPRVLGTYALAVAAISLTTGATTIAQRRVRACGGGCPTLILGAGQVGAHIGRRLRDHPEYGLMPVGYLDVERPMDEHVVSGVPFLGGFEAFEDVAAAEGVQHAILAFSMMRDCDKVRLIKECETLGVRVTVVPRFFDVLNGRSRFEFVGGLPLIRTEPVVAGGWRYGLKHSVDRVAAAVLALVAAPLFIAIAIAVKLSSPGPVLFSQPRVGRDGREFDLLKFRSMRVEPSQDSGFLPGQNTAPGGVEGPDRRTTVGRLMRRTSLDELPQLLNVLRGDMSLVGPRPERPEFVLLFRERMPRYQDRLRVKAGMTGWAQVHNLRGQTSIADRIEWDNHYIENWSLMLDLKILLMTILAVLQPQED